MDLVKPKAYIYSRGFIQNLHCNFLMFLCFYMNFGSSYYFLQIFKRNQNWKRIARAIGPIPAQDHCLCGPAARGVWQATMPWWAAPAGPAQREHWHGRPSWWHTGAQADRGHRVQSDRSGAMPSGKGAARCSRDGGSSVSGCGEHAG
jgi:hypothetical protein